MREMLVNNQNPEGFLLSKHRAVDIAVLRTVGLARG